MLKELFDRVAQHVATSLKPDVIKIGGVHTKKWIPTHPDVNLLEIDIEPDPRQHTVLRIEDLAVWTTENSMTFVDRGRVESVLDDSGLRSDRVKLLLHHSSQVEALAGKLTAGLDHRTFLRCVRLSLQKELENAAPGLLAKLKRLNITVRKESNSEVGQGKDTFGGSVAAEAMGLTDVPESILLYVPMWRELDIHAQITCELVIDAVEGRFSLVPRGDSLDQAWQRALEELTDQVSSEVKGRVCQGSY